MADETSKARKLCYQRRAACIMKKAMELQILCGLKIGVVILSPDGKVETWPPELNDVKALLDACKERPRVKSDKRKEDPESCHSWREILVSKLQLLKQREEFFKGKEIATTKKRKGFSEGCLEILNSKLELLKKREMVFLNHRSGNSTEEGDGVLKGKEIVSMEGIEESLCDGVVVAAYGQEEGDVLMQNLGLPLYDDFGLGGEYDDFFINFEEEGDKSNNLVADPQNNGGNAAATFKGKEIATMDSSGILQYTTAHLGTCQCDANGQLTSMKNRMSSKKGLEPNQWHHGSSSSVNHTQNSFTALGNGLPPTATAAEECGELQVRKKARLQYPTAAPLNNNLPPLFTPAEYWKNLLTNVGLVNSTDAMLSLLEDQTFNLQT